MKVDDYDLYEQDFDEFIRRGMKEFGIERPVKKNERSSSQIRKQGEGS